MSLQSILVHLADDPDHMARLCAAYALARKHGAHVTVLYVTTPIGMPPAIEGRGASFRYIDEATARARDRAREIEREFAEWRTTHGMAGEWRTEQGQHLKTLARHSLYADLAIVSQSDPRNLEEMLFSALPDHLAMAGSCATMVLPQGYEGRDAIGRRILVAWKPGRECARAVHDALPLLQAAELVRLAQIEPDAAETASAQRIAEWLRRHGVSPEIRPIERESQSVAGALFDAAALGNCDLMVMGAYSHSRLAELVLGGTTKDVLSGAPLPVLMSH